MQKIIVKNALKFKKKISFDELSFDEKKSVLINLIQVLFPILIHCSSDVFININAKIGFLNHQLKIKESHKK